MQAATTPIAARVPLFLAQQDAPPAPQDPTEGPTAREAEPGGPKEKPADGGDGAGAAARGLDPMSFIPILLILVFVFFIWNNQRREKKQRQQMLSALKKGDRVLTVGGIYGTITDDRENDLVLKVDEQSNTKLHVSRAAIQSVQNQEQAQS